MTGKYSDYLFNPAVIQPEIQSDCDLLFIFNKNSLLVMMTGGEIAIPSRKDIKGIPFNMIRNQYLGVLNGQNCYSHEISEDSFEYKNMLFKDLRSIMGVFDENMFFLAARAFQVMDWDRTYQYCSRCGNTVYAKDDERAKVCPKCGLLSYPRISPAIITAIMKEDKLLLAHNRNFKNNMYSLIAGFVEPGETLEECVEREVGEEIGIRVKNIKYFGSQPWPFPHSMMVAFTAEYDGGEIKPDGLEISDAGWYSAENFPAVPSKGSVARKLIDWYVESQERK